MRWLNMRLVILICVSAALAALRISGITHPAFQAVAHLWVGGLFASWFVGRKTPTPRPSRLWMALVLTFAVELPCALLARFGAS